MKHTYDIAHERDLAVFVRQHFANLGERICLALFEADSPIVARGEPLAAVVAVEACVAHAIAIGNHPHLVIAVASKACGIPVVATDGGQAMLGQQPAHGTNPMDFLNRVRTETKIAVGEVAGPPPSVPETVLGEHGEKIRIVRAGDVAGRVIQVLTDFEQTAEVMGELGEEMTFALYGRLSTEIAKLITQGLQ